MLIPVTAPDKARYRLLQNHYDLVLANALRDRSDIVTVRAVMPLSLGDGQHGPA